MWAKYRFKVSPAVALLGYKQKKMYPKLAKL